MYIVARLKLCINDVSMLKEGVSFKTSLGIVVDGILESLHIEAHC